MTVPFEWVHDENRLLLKKYDITVWFYDILDYWWERQYRNWRPALWEDVQGNVLEAGVGSGGNLKYYHCSVYLVGIYLCLEMIRKAGKREKMALCGVDLRREDATITQSFPSNHFDQLVFTFLCCVMPVISSRLQSDSSRGF